MSTVIARYLVVAGLALLAFGGYIKGSPVIQEGVPVDIAFAGAAVVGVALVVALVRGGARAPGLAAALALALAFVPGALHQFSNLDYSQNKLTVAIPAAFACFIAGAVLLNTDSMRRAWGAAVVSLGLAAALLSVVSPTARVMTSGATAIEGGSTIGLGRATGGALVVAAIWFIMRGGNRVLSGAAILVLGLAVLSAGSRGPVLAAVAAVMVAVGLARQGRRWQRLALVTGGLLAVVWLSFREGLVLDRLTTVADNSAGARLVLWQQTSSLLAQYPEGIGWGKLYLHVQAYAAPDRQYPHNTFLEIGAEGGWIALAVFVTVVVLSIRYQAAANRTPVETVMFALLIYGLVNAQVSGDIGDNRGLWVALGAAFAAAGARARAPSGNDGVPAHRIATPGAQVEPSGLGAQGTEVRRAPR